MLSLMPIENLLENPYAMSYLNKQKSTLKKKEWGKKKIGCILRVTYITCWTEKIIEKNELNSHFIVYLSLELIFFNNKKVIWR